MRAWIVGALSVGVAVLGAAPATPTDVVFPVAVHDAGGRVVSSLSAVDFQVTDRGAPVPVVDATWVPDRPPAAPDAEGDVSGASGIPADEEQAAAQAPNTRVIALFLDEYHIAADDVAGVRAALATALREVVRPHDLVLTVKPLDPLSSLVFHRGDAAALAAVASLGGRLGDYEARNAFERDLVAADPSRIDRARTQIALSAVQAIATRLARLGPSRKSLLVVGERLPAPSTASRRAGDGMLSADALARLATRGNVAVSVLDPRGGDGGTADAPADPPGVLHELVRLTGGRAMRADDHSALRSGLGDMGGHYLLTVRGSDDGMFHPLEIRTGRAGVRVRARPGYWALSRDEVARAEHAVADPPSSRPTLPPVRVSRLITPWVGQARLADGRTRVSFAWEPAPARAGDRSRVLPPSRLVLRVHGADGATVFEGTVQPASAGIGASSEAHFDVWPGRLRLEMSIEDASARVLDLDARDLVVAPPAGDLSLGTPRVFRTRTAREFAAVQADVAAAPVASRAFSRSERLLVRVPVHVPDSGDASGGPLSAPRVDVTASLLNRMGHLMRQVPVTHASASGLVTADLPLAGLAAGEYRLDFRAVRAAVEVTEGVSFRVLP